MIRIDKVSKSWGDRPVLRQCSLEVDRGETLVVIGSSGSGKSTLLRCIIGLLEPDSGRVLVDGQDVHTAEPAELAALRARMGYLFQSGALINWLSVGENVALPLVEAQGRDKREVRGEVEHALEIVGLAGTRKMMPSELSGGMRKRAGLARSIVTKPEILLYDEPTTGLDPVTAHIIDQLIVDMSNKLGVTSIVVSHDMEGVYRVADRIAMLYEGRIVAMGSPDEIRGSQDAIVRQFVSGALDGPLSRPGKPKSRPGKPPAPPGKVAK
jgi:phospholipid/cholesterol/gamma-HCH transport system ATP-binding protein